MMHASFNRPRTTDAFVHGLLRPLIIVIINPWCNVWDYINIACVFIYHDNTTLSTHNNLLTHVDIVLQQVSGILTYDNYCNSIKRRCDTSEMITVCACTICDQDITHGKTVN